MTAPFIPPANAVDATRGEALDIMLPGCTDVERDLRIWLHGCRDAASALVASTESTLARSLAWEAAYISLAWWVTPANVEELANLKRLARRLMITALDAEKLHDEGLLT